MTLNLCSMNGCARALLLVGLAAAALLADGGCATGRATQNRPLSSSITKKHQAALREKWGIEIASLRMSGHGHMIDFRYRVIDPSKAGILADVRYTPCLVDQATGIRMKVPNTPKLGPLRQSAKNLEAGKIYFMLFANNGLLVKSGSKVTVLIGDFKVENLSVE